MSRLIVALTLALGCAVALQAQESKSKTTVKGGEAKTLTYTGCVQTGTETRSYILDKVVPVSSTTTTEPAGTSGTMTRTTTTYALVPGQKVELQQHVGHKVEVTGMLIPAGKTKTEKRTKIEREHGKDTKIEERSEGKGSLPEFRVVSIKELAESCN